MIGVTRRSAPAHTTYRIGLTWLIRWQ